MPVDGEVGDFLPVYPLPNSKKLIGKDNIMEPFILTKEIIDGAADYLPLKEKARFLDICLDGCLDVVNVKAEIGTESVLLPPMHKENSLRKARYLMTVLACGYLKIPVETEYGKGEVITEEEYDRLSRSHLYNQIERAKSDREAKGKIFDIMSDYKDFEKRLNSEIYSFLQVMNDPASRIMSALGEAGSRELLAQSQKEVEEILRLYSERMEKVKAEGDKNGNL